MFGLGLTLLQQYWALRLGLVSVRFIRHLVGGTFYDKTHGNRDPDAPYGLFQFKKRFGQYYFLGVLGAIWVTWNLFWTCAGYGTSPRFTALLEYVGSPGVGTADSLHALIASSLLMVHLCRRYYESLSVCIYSGRQLITPFEVLFYLMDFFAMALTMAADLPPPSEISSFTLEHLSWRPLLAIPIFFFGKRIQYQTHLKLAQLRKNRAGHVVTTAYKMPKDDWFEKLSGPHYFAKVLIYLSLNLIMGYGCPTLYWLTAYVITNQVYLAHGTHNFYIKKFDDYPKERKMLIPYLL